MYCCHGELGKKKKKNTANTNIHIKRWLNLQLPTNMHMALVIEIIVLGTILLQSLSGMCNWFSYIDGLVMRIFGFPCIFLTCFVFFWVRFPSLCTPITNFVQLWCILTFILNQKQEVYLCIKWCIHLSWIIGLYNNRGYL